MPIRLFKFKYLLTNPSYLIINVLNFGLDLDFNDLQRVRHLTLHDHLDDLHLALIERLIRIMATATRLLEILRAREGVECPVGIDHGLFVRRGGG